MNSHLCPVLIIPNSYSRGVIKSIVTRPPSHTVPPNLHPSDWCSSTHFTSASHTLLFCSPSPAVLPTLIINPKNVHLPLLSNLLHYHLKWHSLPTTRPGVLTNPTLFSCPFFSSYFHLVNSKLCSSPSSDSCLLPSA